ncbi:histone H1B-like [Aquila chrysaetos chrysaetos]|uniref:histone H1B-like n=1 Tax=Aquila chrysaetos chrysaetos TaxID=223781 RepID=UPI001B7D469D|nr:histone H1B-like [Aquila chrysaetos chrysaetos]
MSGEQVGEPQPSTSRAGMSLPQKRGWPSLSDLILTAVCSCTARKGASFAFIKKTLATEGYDVVRNGGRLKAAVGALLSKGLLRRVTGSGLAGSFRLGRVGKERLEGTGRRGRAVGEARRRPAGKTKGPRRAVKAAAQRLKMRPRGKAKAAAAAAEEDEEEEAAAAAAAAGGVEEVGGPAPAEGES